MFSTHEVVHMSKCLKEGHRRCAVHGEQYIMFSNTQKNMLCVNCFRDTPTEARLHCVDIDTAYTQGCKKLDRAVMSVCDLQNSVREGLLMFKTLLEELRRNMESEKHTINSFCQGMQEAIAKTHASMIMEVQRQFETKERQFRGQLVNLGTVLPLIQLHLLLCSSFSSAANKYQFLDLAYPMMDRLAAVSQLSQPPRPVQSSQIRTNYRSEFSHALEPWVGKSVMTATQQQQAGGEMGPQVSGPGLYEPSQQHHGGTQHFHPPPSRRQHSALRAKALEGEGPFSNHCRSFDSQIKELSQQLCGVKERLGELHRDVTLLRRAHTPPLAARYEHVTRECALLEEQLERHQVELERLKNVFDTLWEEQLCRIHVEQEIFQSQMNDILTLHAEVKHLSLVAHQLEPYVKSLATAERSQASSNSVQQQQQQETTSSHQQLQSLLEHISMLQLDAASSYRLDSSGTQKGECRMHPGQVVTSPAAENIMYMKVDGKEAPVKEVSRTRSTSSREQQQLSAAMLDVSGSGVSMYGSRQQQAPVIGQSLQNVDTGRDGKRGVLSQLIEKVRTKEDRKKSPVQEEARVLLGRERSKSDGRGGGGGGGGGGSGSAVVEGSRTKLVSGHQGDETKPLAPGAGGKSTTFRTGKADTSTQRYSSSTSAPSRESSSSKVASLYHTISGKVLGSRDSSDRTDTVPGLEMPGQGTVASHHHLPPPPPPTTSRRPQSHHEDIPSHLDVRERLEAHLKEKLHEMMGRRLIRPSSVGEKGVDSQGTEESEYQRISEATTSPIGGPDGGGITKQAVRAMIHREPSTAASTPTSPHRQGKMVRLYPASDTEDSVFYATEDQKGTAGKSRKQNSCESLTLSTVSVNSRRSSVDLGDRKTLVVVIGTSSKGAKARLMQKQRSWETFPPKKRGMGTDERGEEFGKFCRDPDAFRGGFELRPAQSGSQGALGSLRGEMGSLKKADSFEGHEEAVRTLVAAVQETRTQHLQQQQQQQRKQSQPKQGGGGN